MKLKKVISKTFLCTCLLSAHAWGADILMVGVDNSGSPVDVLVPEAQYKANLKKALVAVETSTLPVLQNKSESPKGWMLRTAVIGIGVNMNIGIGEWKFGVLPRFRVGFTNSNDPSVP